MRKASGSPAILALATCGGLLAGLGLFDLGFGGLESRARLLAGTGFNHPVFTIIRPPELSPLPLEPAPLVAPPMYWVRQSTLINPPVPLNFVPLVVQPIPTPNLVVGFDPPAAVVEQSFVGPGHYGMTQGDNDNFVPYGGYQVDAQGDTGSFTQSMGPRYTSSGTSGARSAGGSLGGGARRTGAASGGTRRPALGW